MAKAISILPPDNTGWDIRMIAGDVYQKILEVDDIELITRSDTNFLSDSLCLVGICLPVM